LGAVAVLAFGVTRFPFVSTMFMAILFAFGSMLLILFLAYTADNSLATNTIILIGVIFSMFAGSIMSLLITFSGDQIKSITFWLMGSMASGSYAHSAALLCVLAVFGAALNRCARELDAFAIGEDNARHVGVNVRRVKLIVMISVSALIGVCVSIGGTIGFVGLVIPHMTRLVSGPRHRILLPASLFSGAAFLMLADLISRVILNPLELPIGVITSLFGSIVFLFIFIRRRKSVAC
jgi:iron complex transport system permease protein